MHKKKSLMNIKNVLLMMSLLCNLGVILFILYNWGVIAPKIANRIRSFPTARRIVQFTKFLGNQKRVEAEKQELEKSAENIAALMSFLAQKVADFPTESKRLDYIRNFIYTNSVHPGGEDYPEYAWDIQKVLSMLYSFFQTQEDPPHLTCGSRTQAMQMILEQLGRKSRHIMIFSDAFTRVRSHTFLEVFNQETDRWEIHDPDKNLYYRHSGTGVRGSVAQLVWGQRLEDLKPCSSDSLCGWEEHNLVRYIENRRFGAVMYDRSVILVNTDRFSLSKKFPDDEDMNFLEFVDENFDDPVFILNQQFD